MFFEWVISTILVSASVYLLVMLFYYKSLLKKEQKSKNIVKNTLEEAEIVIRKYQIQLQRALGNIDILSDELSKVKNDIKSIRSRNSQYRLENEKLRQKIKELETKIEALL
jgi:septal ring factor EnvC (AmiA/AmiB activator)